MPVISSRKSWKIPQVPNMCLCNFTHNPNDFLQPACMVYTTNTHWGNQMVLSWRLQRMGYFSASTYYKFKSLTVFYSKDIQYSLSRCGQQSVQRILGHCSKTVCKTVWSNPGSELVELAATGGCGGRGCLQCLKGLEELMVQQRHRQECTL